jgi:hypothetical protein
MDEKQRLEIMSDKNGAHSVRISTLMECVKAAHLSTYVDSQFSHASGLMIVGPPGVLKTTILKALDPYESVLTLSDVNSKVLHGIIKTQLTNNAIKSLVLPEVQRIYERDPRTAAGVEGTIRSLVEEGFSGASFEDPTVSRFTARAFVIGAMTDKFRDENWQRWNDSGFARRFLWCLIRLGDPSILMNAVEQGRMAMVADDVVAMPTPPLGTIPALDVAQRKRIRPLVRKQPKPSNVQFELMCRMAAALVYYYKRNKIKRDPIETIQEFGGCVLGGAELTGLVI